MLSHENIVANLMQLVIGERKADSTESNLSWKGGKTGQGDKILSFLPFFHIYVCHNHFLP